MESDEMVVPLFDNLQPTYAEEGVMYDDYLCGQFRGSEVVPCDVQRIRDPYGQQ